MAARCDKTVRVWVGDPLCAARRIRVAFAGRVFTVTPGIGDALGKSAEAFSGQSGGVAGSPFAK